MEEEPPGSGSGNGSLEEQEVLNVTNLQQQGGGKSRLEIALEGKTELKDVVITSTNYLIGKWSNDYSLYTTYSVTQKQCSKFSNKKFSRFFPSTCLKFSMQVAIILNIICMK